MGPEAYLTIELEPSEAFAETLKSVILPWSGRAVTIRVPAGTADGSVLRLAGLGPPAPDGSPQDAYVRVVVRAMPAQFGPPPHFEPAESADPAGPPFPPGQFGPHNPSGQFGPHNPSGQFGMSPPAGTAAPPNPAGPGQPLYGPTPLPPPAPARRRTVLIGVAVAVVALLACCGLPLAFFFSGDDADRTPAAGIDGGGPGTASVAPSPSAPPATPEQYQALLTETDRTLKAGFDKLATARNPKGVRSAASALAASAATQSRTLDGVAPPQGVTTTAHASLVGALEDLAATLNDTGTAASYGRICLGPAAVSQVSREAAADRLRSAAQALATADPTRAYQVGSFVPKETKDSYRRPGNGSYIKRTQGGLGQLKIENGGTDSVISIVRGKTAVTRVYVRSKNKFTVRGVRDGTYQVFMASGKDWDSRLKAFSRDCEFEKFDDSFKFTTTSRTYTGWTITLTPVVGGNARTSDVDPDDFPGG